MKIKLQWQQMIAMNSDVGAKGALLGGVAGSPHPAIVKYRPASCSKWACRNSQAWAYRWCIITTWPCTATSQIKKEKEKKRVWQSQRENHLETAGVLKGCITSWCRGLDEDVNLCWCDIMRCQWSAWLHVVALMNWDHLVRGNELRC